MQENRYKCIKPSIDKKEQQRLARQARRSHVPPRGPDAVRGGDSPSALQKNSKIVYHQRNH